MIAQELEVSLHMAFVDARQKRHEFITVEHLLLALLDNPSASEVLKACAAKMDELRKALTEFIEQLAGHPLHHLGLALAKGFTGGQLDHGAGALFQADQPLLDGWRQLPGPQAERGGRSREGIDVGPALQIGHAVVQGEEGTVLDLGHGREFGKGTRRGVPTKPVL